MAQSHDPHRKSYRDLTAIALPTIASKGPNKSEAEDFEVNYSKKHPYNYIRHFVTLISDRSINFFVICLSAYTITTDKNFSEIFMAALSLPLPLVIFSGVVLLGMTVWQQYATYEKQKKLKQQEIAINNNLLQDLYIIEELNKQVNKFTTKPEDLRKTLEEQAQQRINNKKKKDASSYDKFKKLDWVPWWKRTLSPAARSGWPGLLFFEFNPLGLGDSGVLFAVSCVLTLAIFISIYWLASDIYQEKEKQSEEIELLKETRKEAENEIEKLEKSEAYLLWLRANNKNNTKNEIINHHEKLKNSAPPSNSWFTTHRVLSSFTILCTLGIGSSVISALARLGLNSLGEDLSLTLSYISIAILCVLVFALAMAELIKSFKDSHKIEERLEHIHDRVPAPGDDSKPGIKQLIEDAEKLNPSLDNSNEAKKNYELMAKNSTLMKIYNTVDAPVQSGINEQFSKDYLVLKCIRKAYKATRTAAFIIVFMAFGILPPLYEIPLIATLLVAAVAVSEYLSKTHNIALKHSAVHQRKPFYYENVLKQVAVDQTPKVLQKEHEEVVIRAQAEALEKNRLEAQEKKLKEIHTNAINDAASEVQYRIDRKENAKNVALEVQAVVCRSTRNGTMKPLLNSTGFSESGIDNFTPHATPHATPNKNGPHHVGSKELGSTSDIDEVIASYQQEQPLLVHDYKAPNGSYKAPNGSKLVNLPTTVFAPF